MLVVKGQRAPRSSTPGNAGALVKLTDKVSAGFVFNKRPEFVINTRVDAVIGCNCLNETTTNSLKIPDSFAFGISIRPNDRLTLNVDAQRVLYSQLMRWYFNATFESDLSEKFFDADFERRSLTVEDTTEFRVGGEYVAFVSGMPVAMRAGYWREPFHSVVRRIEDSNIIFGQDSFGEPFFSRTFVKTSNHLTFGAGITVAGRVSVDFADDWSKDFNRFIVSTVLYLG